MATDALATPTGMPAEGGVKWGWLLALGILMTVLGVIGLGMSYGLTIAAMFWFGILAIIGGIAQIIDAFHHKGWGSVIWHVIIGIVYVLAGIMLIVMPVVSAFWLTLFLAVSLVVTGVLRIMMAFRVRGEGSAWLLVALSGLVSIVLGIMIWGVVTPPSAEALATPAAQLAWVRSWGWVIGLFIAIEFIMEGVALIFIALMAKKVSSKIGSMRHA